MFYFKFKLKFKVFIFYFSNLINETFFEVLLLCREEAIAKTVMVMIILIYLFDESIFCGLIKILNLFKLKELALKVSCL